MPINLDNDPHEGHSFGEGNIGTALILVILLLLLLYGTRDIEHL